MFAAVGASGVQEATTVVALTVCVEHVVATQLLAEVATDGTHDATRLLDVMGVGQVVVVQLLAAVALDALQLATGTFVVLLLPQVVLV